MKTPKIPQTGPYILQLDPGEYLWCACGRSNRQPFCDGSHAGSGFSPVKFTVSSRTPLLLCGCKHSKTMPYCDGSHNDLPAVRNKDFED